MNSTPTITMPAQPKQATLAAAIRQLARDRSALILAHNYQVPEVQDVAHMVGDSLALAREAKNTSADVVLLCGVYFMAETAKLLNPDRIVVIPDATAGCSLADSITVEELRAWKAMHPEAVVVSYVNTTAAVKAESDWCVTSGNAAAVINAIPADKEILFLPDLFLGDWLRRTTRRRNIHVWPGECHVHAGIRPEEILAKSRDLSDAEILIHPECGCTTRFAWGRDQGMLPADRTHVLSTEGMVRHVRTSRAKSFIVATETGILHRLHQEAPDKIIVPADDCAVCPFMKMITLEKVRCALETLSPRIEVDPEIAARARMALDRMLAL